VPRITISAEYCIFVAPKERGPDDESPEPSKVIIPNAVSRSVHGSGALVLGQ
jgi:hypothetical protein